MEAERVQEHAEVGVERRVVGARGARGARGVVGAHNREQRVVRRCQVAKGGVGGQVELREHAELDGVACLEELRRQLDRSVDGAGGRVRVVLFVALPHAALDGGVELGGGGLDVGEDGGDQRVVGRGEVEGKAEGLGSGGSAAGGGAAGAVRGHRKDNQLDGHRGLYGREVGEGRRGLRPREVGGLGPREVGGLGPRGGGAFGGGCPGCPRKQAHHHVRAGERRGVLLKPRLQNDAVGVDRRRGVEGGECRVPRGLRRRLRPRRRRGEPHQVLLAL